MKMKLTKKEIIEHLEQYPDDYELVLSHYFQIQAGGDEENPSLYCAQVNLPVMGTAADEEKKEIRLVLDSSSGESMRRIENKVTYLPQHRKHVKNLDKKGQLRQYYDHVEDVEEKMDDERLEELRHRARKVGT